MKEHKNQITIRFSKDDLYSNMDIVALLRVGNKVIVYANINDTTGNSSYSIMEDNGEGIRALMNPQSFAYHGWRSTYCGISTYGHGLREIKRIVHVKDKNRDDVIKVVLGPDLVPDKD